jgi:ubiquinone/menaquinone biosynthesis C-methylase UbiE
MPEETAVYTHGHHESVLRSHRWRTAANSAAYLIDRLAPGLSVLDVGCGPGTITADLAALVAPGRVTAVDTSAEVLSGAAAVAAERGLENVEFATADVHDLDFPDDSFDVVHAHQVLQHVGDPVRALREMRRVCRPGGRLVILNHFRGTNRLGAWLDRVISPLTVHIGFKSDLDLPAFLAQAELKPVSIEKVNVPRIWSLITCIKE